MTPYEDKTVDYLARQLEGLGLEPAFNGSWFQPFEMIAVTAKPVGGKLTVSGKKKSMLRTSLSHVGLILLLSVSSQARLTAEHRSSSLCFISRWYFTSSVIDRARNTIFSPSQ